MRLAHYLLCGLALVGLALASCVHQSTAVDPVGTESAAPTSSAATTPSAAWTSTVGLDPNNGITGQDRKPVVPLATGVHPVKLIKTDGKWQLLRDGKPYFIKGVGGDSELDKLVAMGGNSVRIWGIDAKTAVTLNECAKRDITVLLGYWVGQKKVGFHSDDPATAEEHARGVQAGRQDLQGPPRRARLGHRQRDGERQRHARAVAVRPGPRQGLPRNRPQPSHDDRGRGDRRPAHRHDPRDVPGCRHRRHQLLRRRRKRRRPLPAPDVPAARPSPTSSPSSAPRASGNGARPASAPSTN